MYILKHVEERLNTHRGCNAMYVQDVEDGKRAYTHIIAHNFLKCIVRSNFRRKEPLYLFIQALFVSGTCTGFRDLLFSLLFPAKNISSTMMRQKVR